MTETASPIYIPNRALIAVTGADALDLLQRLVTADLAALQIKDNAVYTLLLTPQGRVRFDFFVIRHDGKLWLDAAATQATELMAALLRYRLRADAGFEVVEGWRVTLSNAPMADLAFSDPRHPGLGWRNWQAASDHVDSRAYHDLRVRLGVVEPSEDLPENATPLDYSLDRLGAISFSKGCYLGQELTARTHNRDLAKYEVAVLNKGDVTSETVLAEAGRLALVQRRRAVK